MINASEEKRLESLREEVSHRVSGKRLTHTLAVERECAALAEVFCPEDEAELRAAGLLHDITKQLSLEKQLQLCREFGIIYTPSELLSPKTFHARTAERVVERDFPELATPTLLSAVRYHTTGRAGMTLGEKIVYLADYIEDTRTFPDCVELREYFWSGIGKAADRRAREEHLRDTLILSFDMTIRGLIADGDPICIDTVSARNCLIEEKQLEKQ